MTQGGSVQQYPPAHHRKEDRVTLMRVSLLLWMDADGKELMGREKLKIPER